MYILGLSDSLLGCWRDEILTKVGGGIRLWSPLSIIPYVDECTSSAPNFIMMPQWRQDWAIILRRRWLVRQTTSTKSSMLKRPASTLSIAEIRNDRLQSYITQRFIDTSQRPASWLYFRIVWPINVFYC
jgi:hypothetical protein